MLTNPSVYADSMGPFESFHHGDVADSDIATAETDADDLIRCKARLRAAAIRWGFAGFGVCDVAPFAEVRAQIDEMVASGRSARLRFTFADSATATDVRRSFPWAERLVVIAWSYLPAAGHPGDREGPTGRIARFAGADHYVPVRNGLGHLARIAARHGFRTEILVDDNRLVDRAAAVRAGVGWWGKNTMVLRPGAGPWLLLGSMVTDAPLDVDAPMMRDCGTCSACLPACPTGALIAPGVLDARLCLAAVLQSPGVIPADLRAAVGDRVYGCDDCLDACPPGSRLLQTTPIDGSGRVDLIDLLTIGDRALAERYDRFYVPRNDMRFLRRNAIVALGNVAGPEALSILVPYLFGPDWMLRLHAAWAIAAVGGAAAATLLTEALRGESRPETKHEITEALARLS